MTPPTSLEKRLAGALLDTYNQSAHTGPKPCNVAAPFQRMYPMPTKRRRVHVTPSDEVWALVDEIHALTGTAKAAILAEILDEVAPVFSTQIQALRVLKDSPREAQRLIQNFANESVSKLVQANLDLDAVLDGRTVKGKRARRKGGTDDTP